MKLFSRSLKRFLPRSLFGRSLLILVLPVVLIQVITSIVFFDRHWTKTSSRFAYAVSGEIAVLVNAYKDEVAPFEMARLVGDFERYLDVRIAFEPQSALPGEELGPLTAFWERLVARTLEMELDKQIYEPFVLHYDLESKRVMVFIKLNDGVLKVRLPERRLFSSSGYIFLLWVFGASLLLLLISVLFMRNQVRPIRKLAVAAERMGKGQDVTRFKPEGAREVRQAAQSFIDMRRRIQRQISQRTEMLAGISHDLRTPLTRLKLELEMLSAEVDTSDMKEDVAQMERMITSYLEFVRGEGDEAYEFVNVSDILFDLASRLKRQGAVVGIDVPEDIRARVRPLAFERAVNNLLQNAAKYAERVWMVAYTQDERLMIEVHDDGPGVAQELYREVFKPFKRVEESRNSETGGVGLGLSIALDIVQAHGGDIVLSESEHGGLCAAIRLPL